MSDLLTRKVRLVTTEFVLLEVADALSAPNLRSTTIQFLNQLRQAPILLIIPLSQDLLAGAWAIYSQRLDKSQRHWSGWLQRVGGELAEQFGDDPVLPDRDGADAAVPVRVLPGAVADGGRVRGADLHPGGDGGQQRPGHGQRRGTHPARQAGHRHGAEPGPDGPGAGLGGDRQRVLGQLHLHGRGQAGRRRPLALERRLRGRRSGRGRELRGRRRVAPRWTPTTSG